MWLLKWHQRNKAREKDKSMEVQDPVHKIRCYVGEYLGVFCANKTQHCTTIADQLGASGARHGNNQCGWGIGEDHGGWGMIARDTNGVVIEDKAKCAEHIREAFLDEL